MKRILPAALSAGALLTAGYVFTQWNSGVSAATSNENASETNYLPDIAPVGATLLEGLGGYSRPITSEVSGVQRWFDQGFMLTYGFNHEAAERSFLNALELDPECAMCWWGAAYVLGPHVNAEMDPENNQKAWERSQAALSVANNATPWEQALIEALSFRYAENPPADRTSLDRAYSEAMAEAVGMFPENLDIATLYAESLMDLQPWSYWDAEGNPTGNTEEIIQVLEGVIERNEKHPGALHLYIHAVEASDEPERGVEAADRLRTLVPGAGHLVHMPAHIYARVGRWNDAAYANERAIEADDAYLAACRPGPAVYPIGYVPHNHHFLWFAASMAGRKATALEAAWSTHERTSDPEMLRTQGFDAMQDYASTPLFAQVRFGLWEEITEAPRPAEDLPYMVAIWEYAQGMAAVRQGRLADAEIHHQALTRFASDPTIKAMQVWDRYSMIHSVQIAERTLAGELAWANDNTSQALKALNEAVAMEDQLPYDEPPAWHAPVRMTLGVLLLDMDRPEEAEEVYRQELRRNPENGWSLFGLEQAQRAQGKTEAANQTAERFERAWAEADIELESSRL